MQASIMQAPLASRMRPQLLADYVGQKHLLGQGKPLANMLSQHKLQSLLFWGPPGSGKTTLAQLMAAHTSLPFIRLSAVTCSTKDIRTIAAEQSHSVVVFIDEIHRFNKAQQDALLPLVESGQFILIGATTENPSFNVNKALLSRVQLYRLQSLTFDEVVTVLQRALLLLSPIQSEAGVLQLIATTAQGDARRALNILELAVAQLPRDASLVTSAIVESCLETVATLAMDRKGDVFYELISALHKSIRGSSPDAALYWLARMLLAGCDPLYVARRLVRMASEDIGNADPRAITLALNAWEAQERLGSPEGELALAQAVAYLAVAAKSNAVYSAYKHACRVAKETSQLPVPMHLRNAPTDLMKAEGYGVDYRYAHDYPDGYVPGESYLPEPLQAIELYQPVNRGLEQKIAEKMAFFKAQDLAADWSRVDKG